MLSERDLLLNYFQTTGHIDKFYFILAINFQIGYKEYILHIENDITYCDFAFGLEFYDDISPIIYGEEKFIVNDISSLEINALLRFYTGYDDYDGFLNINLQDVNYININEIEATLYCVDTSKNKTIKKIKIIGNKKNYGLFYKQNAELKIYKGNYLSSKNIIELMIQNNIIEKITNFEVSLIESNLNFNKCGKYEVTLNLNHNKKNYAINLVINVVEKTYKKIPLIHKLIQIIIEFINYFRGITE